jgi:hypothetical protein
MLEGGIGCARLGPVDRFDGRKYILSATFSGMSEEGIPLVVDGATYSWVADQLRTVGFVRADISGKVRILPGATQLRWRVPPTYYIGVETLQRRPGYSDMPVRASAFITYSTRSEDLGPKYPQNETEWATSYCQFTVGRGGDLGRAVDWLASYVQTYSHPGCRIIADFDAYHSYFDRPIDMPVSELMKGRLRPDVVQAYANRVSFPITIFGDVVEGDQFKNIEQSHILNRAGYRFYPQNE